MTILAQWQQLNEPGPIGSSALAAVVLSLFGNVFLAWEKWKKLTPEIEGLNKDIVQKAADTLERLQEKRDAYNSSVERFTELLSTLAKALEENDHASLKPYREECCQQFSSHVIRTHVNYVEFVALYYKGDDRALEDFATDELVDNIRRLTRWLAALNHPILLRKIPDVCNPLTITRQSVKPWEKILLGLSRDAEERARTYVSPEINKLLEPNN